MISNGNVIVHIISDESRVRSGVWEDPACERRVAPPLVHSRTLQHTISQRSSEDSWCSGSEPELSSDEESDRSAASSTRYVINKIYYFFNATRGRLHVMWFKYIFLVANLPADSFWAWYRVILTCGQFLGIHWNKNKFKYSSNFFFHLFWDIINLFVR